MQLVFSGTSIESLESRAYLIFNMLTQRKQIVTTFCCDIISLNIISKNTIIYLACEYPGYIRLKFGQLKNKNDDQTDKNL